MRVEGEGLTMKPYALVLGGSSCPQTRGIVGSLRAKSVDVVFLDHDEPRPVAVDVDVDGTVSLVVDGERLGPPSVVWSRIKLRVVLGSYGDTAAEETLRRQEWRGFLMNVAGAFDDRAIYRPVAAALAESKFRQFQAAGAVGFKVPESSMFLGKQHAVRMLEQHGRLVAKPILGRSLPKLDGNAETYRIVSTMGVDEDDIVAADEEEFLAAPVFMQKRIPSGTELRVIAFRARAFSYALRYRLETKIKPDERYLMGPLADGRRIYGAHYTHVATDKTLELMLSELLQRLDLQYGAFDVVQDDDGGYTFIECNPEGQWYAATGFNMDEVIDHFADVLAARLPLDAQLGSPAPSSAGGGLRQVG